MTRQVLTEHSPPDPGTLIDTPSRRHILGLGLVASILSASLLSGCQPRPTPNSSTDGAKESTRDDSESAEISDDVWRGVCLAHSWENSGNNGYGTASSAESLDHLAALGTEWVSITPFGFMSTTNDTRVRGEHDSEIPDGAESKQRLVQVVAQARQHQLKIMLKPHIWIRGGAWRGAIQPYDARGKLDWQTWWDSHDAWILYYAEIARELEVEALVVGLELHTAVQAHPERLRALAESVREIYPGHITYAANWNEPVPQDVWKSLDSVGVQFYPPLVSEQGAYDEAEARSTMRKHLDAWSRLARRIDRPLVLTEVGYRSADIAFSHPNAWPEKFEGKTDERRQKKAYKLLFEEVANTPNLKGIFLWKYFTNARTDEEGPSGFSPRGKQAEAVVRQYY